MIILTLVIVLSIAASSTAMELSDEEFADEMETRRFNMKVINGLMGVANGGMGMMNGVKAMLSDDLNDAESRDDEFRNDELSYDEDGGPYLH